MKLIPKILLINVLCLNSLFAYDTTGYPATTGYQNNGYGGRSSETRKLVEYVKNLGSYLGFDLTQDPTSNSQTVSQQLLNAAGTQVLQGYVYNTLLGALPVNAISQIMSQFEPSEASGANVMNNLANSTFKNQNYSSTSSNSSQTFTVTQLIDQQTFQQDPVSQSILNILGTPNSTYCMNSDLSGPDPKCQLLNQNKVMNNVIGTIPDQNTFFSYNYNQQLIGQLNSNALLAPLLYSSQQDNTIPQTDNKNTNPGLTAQNQIQEAANFVRYATAAVSPVTLPTAQNYFNLYKLAVPGSDNNVTPLQQMQAQSTLSNYLTNLRIYAAQSSVGIGNLYYILSKRLPQKQGTNSGTNQPILSSQTMSEFNMATWRLFNPSTNSPNKQWIEQLNAASPATVEKEIATLLAEINYQMYLDRQIQERILLTNSIMLIQNTRTSQPSGDFGNQASTTSGQ